MPANTTRLLLPYPVPADTVDVPRDVQALATALDAIQGISASYVTSLPGSPFDGQEIFYAANATNGVIWHLRYRTASASVYKWEFVGGPPLAANIATDETFTQGGAYVDAVTAGPSITVPLAGDYTYLMAADIYVAGQTATAAASAGLSVGGSIPASPNLAVSVATAGLFSQCTKPGALAALAASTALKLQYNISGAGGTAHARFRELQVLPVRVG